DDAHTLTLRSLRWAEGRYQAQATLGAQAPMPLQLQAHGELNAQVPEGENIALRARATAQGALAGEAAALDLTAQIEPAGSTEATPTLAGSARVRPWAAQPLAEADLRLHRLDVAALWPQAPRTALTGTVSAQPEGTAWQARARLQNERPGPIDQRRVPLESLELDVQQTERQWTLQRLDARVAGGRVQGQGQRRAAAGASPASASTSTLSALGDLQGRLTASGIDPARLWSTLAAAALDGELRANTATPAAAQPAIDIDARIAPAGRQPPR